MSTDIYGQEKLSKDHSLRFIHIMARNVVGILNRIASLMRRKRYNMEEVTVGFDDAGLAHITLAVDGRLTDVEQVMEQISKLHDVLHVRDATNEKAKLYFAIYVHGKKRTSYDHFPIKPVRVVCDRQGCEGVFMIGFDEMGRFTDYLVKNRFSFVRRLISLI